MALIISWTNIHSLGNDDEIGWCLRGCCPMRPNDQDPIFSIYLGPSDMKIHHRTTLY